MPCWGTQPSGPAQSWGGTSSYLLAFQNYSFQSLSYFPLIFPKSTEQEPEFYLLCWEDFSELCLTSSSNETEWLQLVCDLSDNDNCLR